MQGKKFTRYVYQKCHGSLYGGTYSLVGGFKWKEATVSLNDGSICHAQRRWFRSIDSNTPYICNQSVSPHCSPPMQVATVKCHSTYDTFYLLKGRRECTHHLPTRIQRRGIQRIKITCIHISEVLSFADNIIQNFKFPCLLPQFFCNVYEQPSHLQLKPSSQCLGSKSNP